MKRSRQQWQKSQKQNEQDSQSSSEEQKNTKKHKRPKGLQRKVCNVNQIQPEKKQYRNIVNISGWENVGVVAESILNKLLEFQFVGVAAIGNSIQNAFKIVEWAVKSGLQKFPCLYRINIPGTIEIVEIWEDKKTHEEVWRRIKKQPSIKIELSLKPQPQRHIGIQEYTNDSLLNYNRPKRYRLANSGSRPKIQRIE